jgi:thiamine pyrophosphokinase
MQGGDKSPVFPKQGKRAVILCDGPPPPTALLEYWLVGADLFICTDRAGHPYEQLPLMPNVVIGDFDSLAGSLITGRGGPVYMHDNDQETTDSEKALHYAESEDCTEAVMLGAAGWLLDHTLHNCALVEQFAGSLRICLSDEHSITLRLGTGETASWNFAEGTAFSLIPLTGPVRIAKLQGGAWSLEDEVLEFGFRSAVSNLVSDPPLFISVESGSVMVILRHLFVFDADPQER